MSGSISTSATQRIPPTTVVNAVALTCNGTSGITIYTVPADKTFYCTQAFMQYTDAGDTLLRIRDGTTVLLAGRFQSYESASLTGECLFSAPAGANINVQRNDASPVVLNCVAQISGFLL